ncbi:hypothetical protein PS9374_07215 [Planomonospora sphaerica]|uniref:Uncharacterized protein n=1 Tax=Planomonospora sphaerica TaxID=161355 RepID=A0A171DR48_9ACTN|nr:hypothetical protein [Planomonospora sphaerica]GAT71522.1 hypothetical protein PS9374_07215 [Planomonospora sphaerica]
MRKTTSRALILSVGLVLVVALAMFGMFLWWLTVEWLGGGERAEVNNMSLRSTAASEDLKAAAEDGELTVREVNKAVGFRWAVERMHGSLDVVAYFSVEAVKEETGLCILYKINLPLGPATSVTRTELPKERGNCRELSMKYVRSPDSDASVL